MKSLFIFFLNNATNKQTNDTHCCLFVSDLSFCIKFSFVLVVVLSFATRCDSFSSQIVLVDELFVRAHVTLANIVATT